MEILLPLEIFLLRKDYIFPKRWQIMSQTMLRFAKSALKVSIIIYLNN